MNVERGPIKREIVPRSRKLRLTPKQFGILTTALGEMGITQEDIEEGLSYIPQRRQQDAKRTLLGFYRGLSGTFKTTDAVKRWVEQPSPYIVGNFTHSQEGGSPRDRIRNGDFQIALNACYAINSGVFF